MIFHSLLLREPLLEFLHLGSTDNDAFRSRHAKINYNTIAKPSCNVSYSGLGYDKLPICPIEHNGAKLLHQVIEQAANTTFCTIILHSYRIFIFQIKISDIADFNRYQPIADRDQQPSTME